MSKLRCLSGAQLVAIIEGFGIGQKGSHIKLARNLGGKKQILTVPNHKEIDTGTPPQSTGKLRHMSLKLN